MAKKIKCKIISSVSFNSDKQSTAVDEAFAYPYREMGRYACYSVLTSKSGSEQEFDRDRLNVLV